MNNSQPFKSRAAAEKSGSAALCQRLSRRSPRIYSAFKWAAHEWGPLIPRSSLARSGAARGAGAHKKKCSHGEGSAESREGGHAETRATASSELECANRAPAAIVRNRGSQATRAQTRAQIAAR